MARAQSRSQLQGVKMAIEGGGAAFVGERQAMRGGERWAWRRPIHIQFDGGMGPRGGAGQYAEMLQSEA